MIASKSISILTQKLLQVMDNIHNQGGDYEFWGYKKI